MPSHEPSWISQAVLDRSRSSVISAMNASARAITRNVKAKSCAYAHGMRRNGS